MIADEITKLASLEERSTSIGLEMEVQKHPSIEEVLTFAIQSTSSWMTPIISFFQDEHLVRLNLINHVLALFHDKFACNITLSNLVFRWESCKGSV